MTESAAVIGFDIGGVIRERVNMAQKDPKVLIEGALVNIRSLVGHVGPKRAVIVSRQPQKDLWEATVSWLRENDFFSFTGFQVGNVHFCEQRAEKAAIARRLGVTHFVDNRTEVFAHMHQAQVVLHKYLFRPREEELVTPRKVGEVHVVWTWDQAYQRIVSTL